MIIKRLNDTLEVNSGKLIQEVKNGKEEYDNNNRCYFFALDESRCSVLSAASEILVKKFTMYMGRSQIVRLTSCSSNNYLHTCLGNKSINIIRRYMRFYSEII